MTSEKLNFLMSISENVNQSLNETVSADIAQFPNLISKIISKVYSKSLVGEIADIQPLTGPVGKVATVFSGYGGRPTSDVKLSNSIVVKVLDSTGFTVGGNIITSSASGVIEYIENNNMLVKMTMGHFSKGDFTLGTITTITGTSSNRFYASGVFKNYTLPNNSESSDINQMNTEIKLFTIEAKSRKMKAIISKEAITDMVKMYGVDITEDLLSDEFANEMIQEIDSEIIYYLRSIATSADDLVLANSLGMQSGLMDIANDIIRNIYHCAQQISSDTKRRQNFFIVADPKTIGLMMISPLQVQTDQSNDNIYYKGRVGNLYELYMDPFADPDDNYCIVGYSNGFKGTGDSGLIYAPYINQIIEAEEYDTGKSIFFNLVRYGYTRHPQDTGTSINDSIFFKTFNIDMSGIKHLTVF